MWSPLLLLSLSRALAQGEFDLYRLLGAGGYGMVLQVRRKSNGQYFACKVLDKRILLSLHQIHAVRVIHSRHTLPLSRTPLACAPCYSRTPLSLPLVCTGLAKETLAALDHPFICGLRRFRRSIISA